MIFENLSRYPDNPLHCLYSMALLLIIFTTLDFFKFEKYGALLMAFFITMTIGAVKEMYDIYHPKPGYTMVGHIRDLVYNVLGMCFAIIILMILNKFE